jgi:AAA+ ATPase superfamily predicted ATPase
MSWGFYGRTEELRTVAQIISRNRWYFAKMTGRRRIGKTTLIQQAIQATGAGRPVFYVQIPDSGPAGVISAVSDAFETFGVPSDRFPRPRDFGDLARLVGSMARAGFLIVLDEFQYFNRAQLRPFCSFLQAEVDTLSSQADQIPGGLVVLGSVHTDLMAILEDRSAPLYNRTTDEILLSHLDIASVKAILREHADDSPERLLFLWTLFEGVPKFYRDCYEQGVLGQDRQSLLRRIFFESSSPLRTEAENWFLRELRGQYDVVLKFVARHAGCLHNELLGEIQQVGGESSQQVGGYLRILSDRYQLIEKKLPVFASPTARRTRYYITDNFLRAWLAALAGPVAAINFRPVDHLVAEADQRLCDVEGKGFEKLVGVLYEERSRKSIGDFPLTERIRGYWDRRDTEIDLVALNETARVMRVGSCKRSAGGLVRDLSVFDGHVQRFLEQFPGYASWRVERVCLAPLVPQEIRQRIEGQGYLVQDPNDLTAGL